MASCPEHTLQGSPKVAASIKDNSAQPDPYKHHKRYFDAWCFCTSSFHTLAAWQGLLLCPLALPDLTNTTLWAEMHTSCCWVLIIAYIVQPRKGLDFY